MKRVAGLALGRKDEALELLRFVERLLAGRLAGGGILSALNGGSCRIHVSLNVRSQVKLNIEPTHDNILVVHESNLDFTLIQRTGWPPTVRAKEG